jgi:SecD/SecF fusion protein
LRAVSIAPFPIRGTFPETALIIISEFFIWLDISFREIAVPETSLAIFSAFYGLLPFSLEIDQAFIAAILTIIGYSLNDTVVVFDRVREYMNSYKKKEVLEVINGALNSTLSRTINTSLTTFVVLLIIFIFGGEVIRGFMFALMVGVIVGTYSSLFVASPIMLDTLTKKKEKLVRK